MLTEKGDDMTNHRRTRLHEITYSKLVESGPMTARQILDWMAEIRFRDAPKSTVSLGNMLTKSVLYNKEFSYQKAAYAYGGGRANLYTARSLKEIRDRIVETRKPHNMFPRFIIELLKEKEMIV